MKAFLFDLDGTLNDSVPQIHHTMRRTMDQLGVPITDQEIRLTIGIPLVETGEQYLGKGRGQELLTVYRKLYAEEADLFPIQAFPGIPQMLQTLHDQGAKLGLVTAKRNDMTMDALQAMGVTELFGTVVDFQCTKAHKPDPEPALYAMEKLGVNPSETCFIGDSIHDLGCGKNAGCTTVGVTWGAGVREQLLSVEPDYLVDSVAELSHLLLDLLNQA